MQDTELIKQARDVLNYARAEYSGFRVGAAILCEDGRVYKGCNIESASYGLTICAERVALFKALSEGANGFRQIAVVTEKQNPVLPCGACRQMLFEYAPEIMVISAGKGSGHIKIALKELLPKAFVGKHLKDG